MKKIIWRDIPWYESCYQISNLWNVKSLDRFHYNPRFKWNKRIYRWKTLKQELGNTHYPTVTLCKLGKLKTVLVHRLIAQAFIPNPDNKPCVNHKNWIRNDNRIENLEWVTYSENTKHAYDSLWIIPSMKWRFWSLNNKARHINQYSLEGVLIKSWDSIVEAANSLWVSAALVSACCRGRRNKTGWFIWKYKL